MHKDEDIITAAGLNLQQVLQMAGSASQQVVKSSFWKLGLSTCYACIDSDSFFIRPFGREDFLTPDGTPYTMLDEGHDLLEDAIRHGRPRIVDAFEKEAALVQTLFARQGKPYSFGPFPLVWHRDVWQSLEVNYLQPRSMTFADAITMAPIESRWYGEALLRYGAIPLVPTQALFKVYHYAWQCDQDRKRGVGTQDLARLYCGVIHQSAWERELDWPREGGNWLSRLGRRIRRKLGRI
ncbi:hypothetical protein DIC66_01945 [Rhodoferax lacus]|uniref:Uncharacterized protein n=1 Tax=Rhodoferax lacus TaxID=2184758 RepID=A0A3E1RHF4_9BURK|nr:hypothetical protein DIC66_01945 [Rhodoferax lacus]